MKKPKTIKVPRTRNGGTMTEAQYWQKIRGALRNAFSRWKPAVKSLRYYRRPATSESGVGRHKFEYGCAICGGWFRADQVRADHIEPVGSLRSLEDLPGFVARLTPENPAAFQCLCEACHHAKTQQDRRELKERRNGQQQGKLPW